MLRRLRNYFFAGLLILIPLGISTWIVWSIFNFFDNWYVSAVQWFKQTDYYTRNLNGYLEIPEYGFGFILTVAVICLVGFTTQLYLGRKFFDVLESFYLRIPGISPIYKGLKQVSETIMGKKKNVFERVVMIEYPRRGLYSIAFVTSNDQNLIKPYTQKDMVYVFLPTTPNPTSGYFLMVPFDDATTVPISVEDGMKMIISSGMVSPTGSLEPNVAQGEALPAKPPASSPSHASSE